MNKYLMIKKVNKQSEKKKKERKFNVPIIGHFSLRSIKFNTILEASEFTGISHYLIFENAIGKIKSARNVHWEFEDGKDWLKYKAQHIRHQRKYTKYTGFNG